jgi:hypothetical protein
VQDFVKQRVRGARDTVVRELKARGVSLPREGPGLRRHGSAYYMSKSALDAS